MKEFDAKKLEYNDLFEDYMVSNGFTLQDNILHKKGKCTIYAKERENTTFIFHGQTYKKSKANADRLLQITKILEGMN